MTTLRVVLSVYCWSLLSISVRGFLEVGVYSRLDASQSYDHSAEIIDWKDTGNKGLDSNSAVKQGATFNSSFTAPLQGVYYVSTILLVQHDNTLLKTTLLINHDLKNKTGLTGFQSSNKSVTVSGLVQLFIGDTVSVYVESTSGNIWTVLPRSTFFVQLVHSLTTHPAFQASLSRDVTFSSSVWRPLEKWNAVSSSDFQIMSGFLPSSGTFCASFNGIYQVRAYVLLDLSESINGSVALFLQNQTIISESSFGSGQFATANIGGIFNLKKGECLGLKVRQLNGKLKIHQESGFSTLFLATEACAKLLHAASYKLSAPAPVMTSAGLYDIGNWTANNYDAVFELNSALLLNGANYQVPIDGQYFINAHINTRTTSWGQEESVQLLVIVDYTSSSVQSDASIVTRETISFVNSLTLTGVLNLKKGQTITLCIYKDGDSAVSLMENSLFSVSMVPKDWPGVSASLNSDQLISNPGWNKIGNWTIGNLEEGTFSFDGAFDSVSGRYVIPLEGTYIVSCNIILNGSVGYPLKMKIAVDDNLDVTNGLYTYRKPTNEYITVGTSGLLRLLPGQSLSVFVYIEHGASWTVGVHSSFSVALNGAGKADEHGFFGVKTQSEDYSTKDVWKELKGWQSRDKISQSQLDRWDATKTRYTPLEDGIYYVSVNLKISYSTANRFQALIVGNGNTNQFSGGKSYHSAQNTNSTFSITSSCSVKLSSSHFVSVFVQSLDSGSWSVLANSSISITLISLMTDPYRAGISYRTRFEDWPMVKSYAYLLKLRYGDTYGSTYMEKLSLTPRAQFDPRKNTIIPESGLYFAVLALIDQERPGDGSNFKKFTAALCIGSGTTQKHIAIRSTKNAEGPSITSLFGISAFGVVYLTKGLNVYPCSYGRYAHLLQAHSGFSLVRIVPRDINPGLRQTGAASVNDPSTRDWTAASDWNTRGETSLYRYNLINPYGQITMNTPPGTYLLTSSLSISEYTSTPVSMCIGKEQCRECYVESSVNNGGLTLSGVVRIPAQSSIYTCVRPRSLAVTRSGQLLPQATANTSLFYRHPSLEFTSSGLKSINSWTSNDGLNYESIDVEQAGLYLVAINIVLNSSFDTVFKVSSNLHAEGRSKVVPGLHGVSWTSANHLLPFGLTSLVRISSKSSLDVTVFTDTSTSWKIEGNATLSVALLTTDATHPGYAVKRAFDASFVLTPVWSYKGDWIEQDIGLILPLSVARPGLYVVEENGIYLVTATLFVSVKVPAGKECTIEMVISIDGLDSDSSLKTLQVISGQGVSVSRTVTLSVASSVRLYKWQTVVPMVRSSPPQKVEILADSIFYVALIDKQRYYSKVNDSSVMRITVHPVSYTRVTSDVCQSISLMCQAHSNTAIRYRWFKDGQFYKEIQNIFIANGVLSDAGRYVCVVESNNSSLSSSISTVDVIATNPVFSQSHFESSVNESLSDQSLLALNFTALNTENGQANVSFTIIAGNVNDTFKLTPAMSTNITTLINTSPLDYEQAQSYDLTIMATNTATRKSTIIIVTVHVIDINDNHPVFRPQNYSASVSEGAWIGALIVQVIATDKDSGNNGRVQFSIDSGNEDGLFDMSSEGLLKVNKTLDYEDRRTYSLIISARDLGSPSLMAVNPAYVTIYVTDVNDIDPTFSSLTYSFRLAENSTVNTLVGQVNATDREQGNNGEITYFIQDIQMQQTFSINQTNGEITLLQSLDYEINQNLAFVVIATDQGTPPRFGAALVHVWVLDVNDNPPVFVSDMYSADVTEATLVGTKILCVRTKDKDSDVNSNVSYIISGGNDGVFTINGEGIIVLEKTLDREHTPRYNLTLEAYDRDSPSLMPHATTTVIINVEDANDHFPQFNQTMYLTSIPENTSIGYEFLKVYATDQDTGLNAEIYYLFDYNCSTPSVKGIFAINETEGVIALAQQIDYETLKDKSFLLKVAAKDGGSPPLTSYANVVVKVTDVNDNPPAFVRVPAGVLHIPDNSTVNRIVFTVSARDQDSGANAQVVYSIEQVKKNGEPSPSKFDIDANNGTLFVSGNFDKNRQDQYEVVIKARDLGTPSLSATISVIIQVYDVNDHAPEFKNSSYRRSFSRSVEKDSLLVTVEATDEDVGNNGVINYTLKLLKSKEGCEKSTFRIASNGSIFNDQVLNAGCGYTLVVTAKDRGEPPLSGTCTVQISVEPTTSYGRIKVVVDTQTVTNVTVKEGEDVRINCSNSAQGEGQWKKEDGSDVDLSSRIRIVDTILIITNSSIDDAGVYKCLKGKNTHIVNLRVNVTVKVKMSLRILNWNFTNEIQDKKSAEYLRFEDNFKKQMDELYKDIKGYIGVEILEILNGSVRVVFRVIVSQSISNKKERTTYKRVVITQKVIDEAKTGWVKNLQVDASPEAFKTDAPPPQPENATLVDVTDSGAEISWDKPKNHGYYDIKGYLIEYWLFSSPNNKENLGIIKGEKTKITGLKDETAYVARIFAMNDHKGQESAAIDIKTEKAVLAGWVIALIVILCILILLIIIALIIFLCRRRKMQMEKMEGDLFAMQNVNRNKVEETEKGHPILRSYTNNMYNLSNGNWTEIPRENLVLLEKIGSGEFGVVHKGQLVKDGKPTVCAVKTLKAGAGPEEYRALYEELEIMANVGNHPNLVNLIGATSEEDELFVIVEFARYGSLVTFLRSQRLKPEEKYEFDLNYMNRLRIALDVAKGMAYLQSKRCVHRDLAARNVLLADNFVAKVADFGLSRDIYETGEYEKTTRGKMPTRWMAIESLELMRFTLKSDVWSYGVLLWEIETKGLMPHGAIAYIELLEKQKKGYRLEQPNGTPDELYGLMQKCWEANPQDRPNFPEICDTLETALLKSAPDY